MPFPDHPAPRPAPAKLVPITVVRDFQITAASSSNIISILHNLSPICYNIDMSQAEKIIKSVESNFALEGMAFSNQEKKVMHNCLSGKTSFSAAIDDIISRYRRA